LAKCIDKLAEPCDAFIELILNEYPDITIFDSTDNDYSLQDVVEYALEEAYEHEEECV